MKKPGSDFGKLVKTRLTFLVVFSASVTFLIGCRQVGHWPVALADWKNWALLVVGGFLVTGAANAFNEIIERDLDKLMVRTADRPLPSGRMTTGQALVIGLLMAMAGTYLLSQLNLEAGLLSVFSILLYAFAYTPLKRKTPLAVYVGAIPGALPPLIGYLAAVGKLTNHLYTDTDYVIALVLFVIQFVWQLPHFWAIAWVLDDDYKKAGFRLLPTMERDKTSAWIIFISTVVLIPVSLLPNYYGFGGWAVGIVSVLAGGYFMYCALKLLKSRTVEDARRVMFGSFIYLPVVQLALLFNFITR